MHVHYQFEEKKYIFLVTCTLRVLHLHMVQTGGSLQEGSQTILEPGHPYDLKTITIGSNHYFESHKQNFTRRAIVDE